MIAFVQLRLYKSRDLCEKARCGGIFPLGQGFGNKQLSPWH
jgi:hypothetical protein